MIKIYSLIFKKRYWCLRNLKKHNLKKFCLLIILYNFFLSLIIIIEILKIILKLLKYCINKVIRNFHSYPHIKYKEIQFLSQTYLLIKIKKESFTLFLYFFISTRFLCKQIFRKRNLFFTDIYFFPILILFPINFEEIWKYIFCKWSVCFLTHVNKFISKEQSKIQIPR